MNLTDCSCNSFIASAHEMGKNDLNDYSRNIPEAQKAGSNSAEDSPPDQLRLKLKKGRYSRKTKPRKEGKNSKEKPVDPETLKEKIVHNR